MKTFFILSAPPCTNGKIHLGHLGGVFIPADVFKRYQQLKGNRVYYITGADENGSYSTRKALQMGLSPEACADLFSNAIRECLDLAHVDYDAFIRTSAAGHRACVGAIYDQLVRNGGIAVEKDGQLYDEDREAFVTDSYVAGNCANCNAGSDAGVCEGCGTFVEHRTFKNPVSSSTGKALHLRETEHAFLRIEAIKDELIAGVEASEWPNYIRDKDLQWLTRQARNLPLTRYSPDGITVAVNGSRQSIPIWYEAVWSFFTGIEQFSQPEGKTWVEKLNEPGVETVVFLGQDNRFLFTTLAAAVLYYCGVKKPIGRLCIQNFLTLEGSKFSTSRNHAIWTDEISRQMNIEVVRFYLAGLVSPVGEEGSDFKREALAAEVAFLQTLEAALREMPALHPAGCAVALTQSEMTAALADYQDSIDSLRFKETTAVVRRLYARLRAAATPGEAAGSLALLLMALFPLMPAFAAAYWTAFFDGPPLTAAGGVLAKDLHRQYRGAAAPLPTPLVGANRPAAPRGALASH